MRDDPAQTDREGRGQWPHGRDAAHAAVGTVSTPSTDGVLLQSHLLRGPAPLLAAVAVGGHRQRDDRETTERADIARAQRTHTLTHPPPRPPTHTTSTMPCPACAEMLWRGYYYRYSPSVLGDGDISGHPRRRPQVLRRERELRCAHPYPPQCHPPSFTLFTTQNPTGKYRPPPTTQCYVAHQNTVTTPPTLPSGAQCQRSTVALVCLPSWEAFPPISQCNFNRNTLKTLRCGRGAERRVRFLSGKIGPFRSAT